jgi:uncharacterized membrane protein
MFLAAVGCLVAINLAAYELHLTPAVWDPLFGSASSERVLTSPLSHLLPVPDAALGALAYLVEVVLTALGGTERWRQQPLLVLVFGIVVAALAATGVVLILDQLVLVHAFCTLCLSSAVISFINAALARDEVLASLRVFVSHHGGTSTHDLAHTS